MRQACTLSVRDFRKKTSFSIPLIVSAVFCACVLAQGAGAALQLVRVEAPPPYIFTRNLSSGMTGDDVSRLQERLTEEIVYNGAIGKRFGPATRTAVIGYQKMHDLPVTGVVDNATRELLNAPVSRTVPEGGLIRAKGDADIYIVKYVGTKRFKRLILSPSVFTNYGHLKWEDVIDVEMPVLSEFATSDLVRAVGESDIWELFPQGDAGVKRLVPNADIFNCHGFDADAVYEINAFDRDSYAMGDPLE